MKRPIAPRRRRGGPSSDGWTPLTMYDVIMATGRRPSAAPRVVMILPRPQLLPIECCQRWRWWAPPDGRRVPPVYPIVPGWCPGGPRRPQKLPDGNCFRGWHILHISKRCSIFGFIKLITESFNIHERHKIKCMIVAIQQHDTRRVISFVCRQVGTASLHDLKWHC